MFWWLGTPGELIIFLNFVNNFHPAIKFTWEYSFNTRSVIFLDLIIWVDKDGYIQTDLYTKDNAKNSYLLPSSNHPSHITKNIPYSLAFRIMRNCSQLERREVRFQELSNKLAARGYRRNSVECAIGKVRQLDRESMLERVVREDDSRDRVRAVFRFDTRLPNLSAIFRKNWQTMVTDDKRLLSVFPKPPMICYMRGRNQREEICRAKLPPVRKGLLTRGAGGDGFKKYGRARCRLCPYTGEAARGIRVVKSVKISNSGVELPIRGAISCTTTNILYILTCSKGGRACPDHPQYCGETGKSAEERFTSHRNTITQLCHTNTTLPVGEHFRLPGHSVSDMVFMPVERIFSSNVFVRKARERNLINQLDLISNGLNRKL